MLATHGTFSLLPEPSPRRQAQWLASSCATSIIAAHTLAELAGTRVSQPCFVPITTVPLPSLCSTSVCRYPGFLWCKASGFLVSLFLGNFSSHLHCPHLCYSGVPPPPTLLCPVCSCGFAFSFLVLFVFRFVSSLSLVCPVSPLCCVIVRLEASLLP
jgi:hypothetical protein